MKGFGKKLKKDIRVVRLYFNGEVNLTYDRPEGFEELSNLEKEKLRGWEVEEEPLEEGKTPHDLLDSLEARDISRLTGIPYEEVLEMKKAWNEYEDELD
jgi:hypothetical protein